MTDCHTPIRVTAQMAEPVVDYDDGLYLDGLLAYGRFRERERAGLNDDLPDPNHVEWAIDFDLPLATWEAPMSGECHARLLDDGKLWGWRASDACWPDETIRGSVALRRMTNVDQLVRHTDAATHKAATGALKNKDRTYPTKQARRLVWWAVGDPERVDTLLREVTHIGKLHGHGQGRVQGWSVEVVGEDRSLESDGVLMRRMPASWADAIAPPRRQTIRPPYWHTSRQVEACYPAGTEVADE